jgi:hypothetical protein
MPSLQEPIERPRQHRKRRENLPPPLRVQGEKLLVALRGGDTMEFLNFSLWRVIEKPSAIQLALEGFFNFLANGTRRRGWQGWAHLGCLLWRANQPE